MKIKIPVVVKETISSWALKEVKMAIERVTAVAFVHQFQIQKNAIMLKFHSCVPTQSTADILD